MSDASMPPNGHAQDTLRIVHVITGLSQGGAENALYRLIAAQVEPGAHHVVSLTDEGVFGAQLRSLGVTVTCLGIRRGLPSPWALGRLARLLRRLRPEVVQTWMYHADLLGGIAARWAGVPVCWGIRHSNISREHNKRLTTMVVHVCAFLSRFIPSAIVSCSARAAELHRAAGYADKFVVIPNGLDLSRFTSRPDERNATRAALGLPVLAHVVGHVGRSDPQKDHRTLIAAFAQVLSADSSAYLLLVGKDLLHGNPYLDGLLAHAAFKNKVIALGPRDDVVELMNAMDVFVLSSVGEAFPNVVAEAMACAVPCVVTDVGDAAEIVADTGWVRQPGDAAGLANDMVAALAEPAEGHENRGQRARQRIEENYDIGRMVMGYQEIWSKVVRRRDACAE